MKDDQIKRIRKYIDEAIEYCKYNYSSINEAIEEEPLFVLIMCIDNILKED